MKRCMECGESVTKEMKDHPYTESGLPNVTLRNIPIYTCDSCGEEFVSIPMMSRLHEVIAFAIAQNKSRIKADEIRFLREYLGYSNKEFAKVMGVSPEHASRWAQANAVFSTTAERLLRILVLRNSLEREGVIQIDIAKKGKRMPMLLRHAKKDWSI